MDKVTRQGLAMVVAKRTGLSGREAYELVGEVIWALSEALKEGKRVELRGLGVLQVVEHQKTRREVPGQGLVEIPSKRRVSFRAAKGLLSALNPLKKKPRRGRGRGQRQKGSSRK